MLDAPIARLREAGAKTEAATDRDGAFSYKSETHSFAVGAGLGVAAGATGRTRLIGAVVGLAVYGSAGETKLDTAIARDVRTEPHYAVSGLGLGVFLGAVVSPLI